MKKRIFSFYLWVILFLIFVVIAACSAIFILWIENKKLLSRPELAPVVYQKIEPWKTFFEANDITGIEGGDFSAIKKELINNSEDFIKLNLEDMELTLFRLGLPERTFSIQSKGKEGSWWETATGLYSVGAKAVNHFSYVSQVWMPYAVQFYGNFFVHGWPYFSSGLPLGPGSSGGCVRLRTEDARVVFEFAEAGMPVLVFDEKKTKFIYPALKAKKEEISVPDTTAESVLVADLSTGEILLNKSADIVFPVGTLTRMMTALSASEVIYLERFVLVGSWLISNEDILTAGSRWRAFDLLYPLLMHNSKTAAGALAGFLGEDNFMKQVERKTRALGMNETTFVDPRGDSPRNISTLIDLAKLMKYINEKRSFLFGVGLGTHFPEKGRNLFLGIPNRNILYDEKGLLGVVSGEDAFLGQSALTVWEMETEDGHPRVLIIGVLASENSEKDTKELLDWLNENFNLERAKE